MIGMPTVEMLRAQGGFQQKLHEEASELARKQFGRKVFVRGVVEISNYCRENCQYCGMRRDNRTLQRMRADAERMAAMLIENRPPSMTDINLQAGEDPVAVREVAVPLIRMLRQHTTLGISVCLGSLSADLYSALKQAGATIYIMKFETAQDSLYRTMQAPGTLEERLAHIRTLGADGWNVSSGFIAGLPGQSEFDLLENCTVAGELPLAGCSVSPFIPGDETPLVNAPYPSINLTLNAMAALRCMRPDWVIPAVSALNISAPDDGYRRGLRTGANLVTINLTPEDLRADYLLYRRDRFIMTEDRILSAINEEGLAPSRQSLADYFRSARMAKAALPSPQTEMLAAGGKGHQASG